MVMSFDRYFKRYGPKGLALKTFTRETDTILIKRHLKTAGNEVFFSYCFNGGSEQTGSLEVTLSSSRSWMINVPEVEHTCTWKVFHGMYSTQTRCTICGKSAA